MDRKRNQNSFVKKQSHESSPRMSPACHHHNHYRYLLASFFAALCLTTVDAWISPVSPSQLGCSLKKSTKLLESSSDEHEKKLDIKGKDIYQRVFYRLAPVSDVDVFNNLVVEERVRFKSDEARGEGYLKPVGPRTLILRDGQVEDGDIGDELFVLKVKEDKNPDATHGGAGMSRTLEATIATMLYVACNPKHVEGKVLEIGCELGLAGLLGSIGAGALEAKKQDKDRDNSEEESEDQLGGDILTIPKGTPMTDELKMLTLTDSDPERLELVRENVKLSRVPSNIVTLKELDWSKRALNRRSPEIFHTIIAGDLDYTYPEARELAHTVAHHLEALSSWEFIKGESKSAPTFIHVCPEAREQTVYLNKFLSKGYRMNTRTGYVKMEKIIFLFQLLPESEPEQKLDDLELQVQEFKEVVYQSLIAEHHPDYTEGAGELFFPMETGEYDSAGGSTYLEPDPGRSPW